MTKALAGPRQDHEPGLLGGEALHRLQIHREHEDGGVQADPQRAAEQHAQRELAVLQDPQVHDGVLRHQLVPDEGDQRGSAHQPQRDDLP
jgi:hypothetical protein